MKPPRRWYPNTLRPIRWACWLICRTVCLLFGVRGKNIENFPKNGPVLVIAPHSTYLDWLFLFGTLPRLPHFIADSFFVYQNLFTAWGCWAGGVIPINRKSADPYCLRQYIRRLSEGEVCVLFPEGARSMEGRALPPMVQAAKLISKLRIPVAIFAFEGVYNAWPRWDSAPRIKRGAVTLRYHGLYKNRQEPQKHWWKGIFDFKSKISVETERRKIQTALAEASEKEAGLLVLKPAERLKGLPCVLCFCPFCSLPDGLTWSEGEKKLACQGCKAVLAVEDNFLRLQGGNGSSKKILADWFDLMIRNLLQKNPQDLKLAQKALFTKDFGAAPEPASLRIDAQGMAIRTDAQTVQIPIQQAAKASIKGTDILEFTYQGRAMAVTAPASNAGTWILLVRRLAGWTDLFAEV